MTDVDGMQALRGSEFGVTSASLHGQKLHLRNSDLWGPVQNTASPVRRKVKGGATETHVWLFRTRYTLD